jgi:signal peptidase I
MIAGLLGAAALVLGTWVWLRRRLFTVTVRGLSMRPALEPGDRVLARRVPLAAVRAGQIVVVAAPDGDAGVPWLIKRVAAVPGDPVPPWLDRGRASRVPPNCFLILGDNAAVSRDSRHLGFLAAGDLLGVVVRRLGTAAMPPRRLDLRSAQPRAARVGANNTEHRARAPRPDRGGARRRGRWTRSGPGHVGWRTRC